MLILIYFNNLFIITVKSDVNEEQKKKLQSKQRKLYSKSLMSTKEKFDFNKKEALRNKEYRKRQALLKINDNKIKVEILKLQTDKTKIQNTNIIGNVKEKINEHDPQTGNIR